MMARAMDLAPYSGQRLGDCIRMTWRDYDGLSIRVKQQKTGNPLTIHVHPSLKTALDKMDKIAVTILTTRTGRPYSPRVFSRDFLRPE